MKKHQLSKSPDSEMYQARDHNRRLVVYKIEKDQKVGAGIMITTREKNACIIKEGRKGFVSFTIGLTNKGLMDLHLILIDFIEKNISKKEVMQWQCEINEGKR